MGVDGREDQDGTDHVAEAGARWRRAGGAVVMVVLAAGAGVLLASVLPPSSPGGPVAPWHHDLSGVLTAVTIVIIWVRVVLVVGGWTRGDDNRAQLSRFSRAQRRRARRCVRRGQAAPREVGGAATLLARTSVRQARTTRIHLAMVATVLSTTISQTTSQRVVVGVVLTVALTAAVAAQLLTSLGARRWLRVHAPASPAQAPSLV